MFASESLVKSDGGELSDFATGPSPFPDTPWQEAQDRRNSFRPGFSSGCACRTSIVPIIAEAANKATHHVVRMSLHPLRVCPFNSRAHCQRRNDIVSPLHGPALRGGTAARIAWFDRSVGEASHRPMVVRWLTGTLAKSARPRSRLPWRVSEQASCKRHAEIEMNAVRVTLRNKVVLEGKVGSWDEHDGSHAATLSRIPSRLQGREARCQRFATGAVARWWRSSAAQRAASHGL